MKRDIKKQAEQGNKWLDKHERVGLYCSEIYQFVDLFDNVAKEHGIHEGLFEVIEVAFKMGVAVGVRNS